MHRCVGASRKSCRFESAVQWGRTVQWDSRLQCSEVALICNSINAETKPAPAKKTIHRCSIQRKLDCWGMFQMGFCYTLNMVKVNYQKWRNMCMVRSSSHSNTRGGHWSPSILIFLLFCLHFWKRIYAMSLWIAQLKNSIDAYP